MYISRFNFSRRFSSVIAGVMFLCFCTFALAQEIGVDMGISAGSAYVFRGATETDGLVLQPEIETRLGAFGFKAWGNANLEEVDEIDDNGVFSDIDLSFFFGVKDDVIDYQVGYIEYLQPAVGGAATRELYASAAWFVSENIQPRVALYYDISLYEEFYGNVGVAYVTFLNNSTELSMSGLLGFMGDDMSLGEDGGLNEYVLELDLLYHLNNHTRVNIELAYTSNLDDDVLPDQPVDFYLVAGILWVMN